MPTSAAAATDGKHPVSALAGPYRHPFHPILVNVPTGAWVASLVFDVISRTGDDAAVFANGAWWLIVIGIVGALAAAIFGFLGLFAIPTGTRAFKAALTHMTINLAVVGLFAVGAAFCHGRLDDVDGTGERGQGTTATAEAQFPFSVVFAHGLFAATTLVLVLLPAINA